MKLNVTRRDVLKFGGGAAVGVMLTPAPWKLVDDVSIWTQNWKWIPTPPRGEAVTRSTVCSLCPAGCAVKARCIGAFPVSLGAYAEDPVSGGTLCALGLTGHHLPYHPARVTRPVRIIHHADGERALAVPIDSVLKATSGAVLQARKSSRSIAVLDMRPGRSASEAWRHFAAVVPGGIYTAPPSIEGSSFSVLSSITGLRASTFVPDIDRARTIVSFGAPLSEGWGTPGRLARLSGRRAEGVRLIHAGAIRSKTAEMSDRWLPVRPGTEVFLALGVGRLLINERLATQEILGSIRDLPAYEAAVSAYTPDRVAALTGVAPDAIVAVARELAANRPALVIAGEDPAGGRFDAATESAILGLNVLLGNFNREGGIVVRDPLPRPFDEEVAPPRAFQAIEDRSIALLIIDASAGDVSIPWPFIARKLIPAGSLVVALSPYRAGTAAHADYIVPVLPFLETTGEMPPSFDSPIQTLAISAPLLAAREGASDPVSFSRAVAAASRLSLSGSWNSSEELMRARVARIYAAGEGSVTTYADGTVKPMTAVSSHDDLWDALVAGGRWEGQMHARAAAPEVRLMGDHAAEFERLNAGAARTSLTLLPFATRDVTASAVVSPVLTKLYQESSLRPLPGTAVLNPQTAAQIGLRAGSRARLRTVAGSIAVTIALDEGVMPGVVALSIGPNARGFGNGEATRQFIDICPGEERAVWRATAVELVEA